MKTLIFGSSGQIGSKLEHIYSEDYDVEFVNREVVDIRDFDAVSSMIARFKPIVVINATAYTAVDLAEEEEREAHLVNAEAVRNLADCCKREKALLVHYSTDYVFDGLSHKPYSEDHETKPLNVYGSSKLRGEIYVRRSGCDYLIIRTSWVCSGTHNNFIKAILDLAKTRAKLTVVNDQIGAVTSASFVANVTRELIEHFIQHESVAEIYHVSSSGSASWFEVAFHTIKVAREEGLPMHASHIDIQAVSSDSFLTKAKRPSSSRLNTEKLKKTLSIELPQWKECVEAVIKEIKYEGELS